MAQLPGRYAVFTGVTYYAKGGASDHIGWAATPEQAWQMVDDHHREKDGSIAQDKAIWCHLLDIITGLHIARPGWNTEGHW